MMISDLDVSRETFDKMEMYVQLIEKWTTKINLISKGSLDQIWDRHIVDSAQIYDLAPNEGHWIDIGSGGGFPGMVLAILSQGFGHSHSWTFVESDQRKCAFLRTAVRELGLSVTVISKRIELIPALQGDILTARALSNLNDLLSFSERHLCTSGTAIFPKGESWQEELETSKVAWSFKCDHFESKTNKASAVLRIQEIQRV